MPDPLSALAIAAFAFVSHFVQTEPGKKFIESIVGKLGEKTVEAGLHQIGELKRKITEKLSGNDKAQKAVAAAETGDPQALRSLAAHLQLEMDDDEPFATEIKQLAEQIINIGENKGQNIQNNYGGQNLQMNNSQSPVVQAEIWQFFVSGSRVLLAPTC